MTFRAEICKQCEANARSNEAAGSYLMAQACRIYCQQGHSLVVAHDAPDNHIPTHKLDVGAVDIPSPHPGLVGHQARTMELRLSVVLHSQQYIVNVADDHSISIDQLANNGKKRPFALSFDTGTGRMLLGYVLRRVICRGIAKSEITEDRVNGKVSIVINLGTFR